MAHVADKMVNTQMVLFNDIKLLPWYHGRISRVETERLLQSLEQGLYLIRDSTQFQGDYSLSVCSKGVIEHFHIEVGKNGKLILGDDKFTTFKQLISYFKEDTEILGTNLIRGVPCQSLKPSTNHSNNLWYHGKISNEHMDKLLAPRVDGMFLVRDSLNYPGLFVLCLYYHGVIEQYWIQTKDYGLTIDEFYYFQSMKELVEYYRKYADVIKTTLKKPVLKQSDVNKPTNHFYNNHEVISSGDHRNHAVNGDDRGIEMITMPWYHGKISREEAAKLLSSQEEGLFLVRESLEYSGDYTLCVVSDKKFQRFHVEFQDNKLTFDMKTYFNTLVELVEYYKVHELIDETNKKILLNRPVVKAGVLESVVNIKDFYNKGWALSKQNLNLQEVLGKGEFGEVYKATYNGKVVAVKQLLAATSLAIQAFLKEASVMASLHHENLVKMIGVVIDKTILLVTEFMSSGNLADYLRSRGRNVISEKDQLQFAIDVAKGMEYLENKNLVHGDLAARNILINDTFVAKVSDFGLATQAESFQGTAKISVKWAAPEVITHKKFSCKSDVWSYGILLWEIYSFGNNPYPRISTDVFPGYVLKGSRMQAPRDCKPAVYQIMVNTWNIDIDKRPAFKELLVQLKQLNESNV